MATSDVAAHLSLADLGRRYRAARDPIERSHLQIVWLSGQGRSEREVAAATGYSRRWIGTIVEGDTCPRAPGRHGARPPGPAAAIQDATLGPVHTEDGRGGAGGVQKGSF